MGQDLSTLLGPLREPKSLREALQLYDARERSCIGLYFPTAADCPQTVVISGESYRVALRDLERLSTLDIIRYRSALIPKLKSLAHGLSCPMHQRDPDHTLQFAYYWVAMECLPQSFTEMGLFLELPLELSLSAVKDAASDERPWSYKDWHVRTRGVIEELCVNVDLMVILHEAVQRLENGWLRKWVGVDRVSVFRKMLERKLEIISGDRGSKLKIDRTKKRWRAWHKGLPTQIPAEWPRETTDVDDDDSFSGTDFHDEDDSGVEEQPLGGESNVHVKAEAAETHDVDNPIFAMGNRTPRPGPSPLWPKPILGAPSTPEPRSWNLKLTRSASKIAQQANTHKVCDNDQGRRFSDPQPSRSRNGPIGGFSPRFNPKSRSRVNLNDVSPTRSHRDDLYERHELKVPRETYHGLDGHVTRHRKHTKDGSYSSTSNETAVELPLLPGSYIDYRDRSPIRDPDTHDDNIDIHIEPPDDFALNPAFPDFQPIKANQKSVRAVTDHVFKEMKKPLFDKKDLDEGYIYTLRLVDRPGFVKIGHTKHTIDDRAKVIQQCFNYELEPINDDDRCEIQYRSRVEKLIHTELKRYRRTFKCDCPLKTRRGKQGCEGSDSLTTHSEWFEIDEARACEVVTRWRNWMKSDPYCNGFLRPIELARLEHFADNAELMTALIVQVKKNKTIQREGSDMIMEVLEDTNTWRWHEYMAFPRWKLYLLLLYKKLFGARISRSTYSRWDSLWEHWQSNVLLMVTFTLTPFMLFPILGVLPFVSATGLLIVSTNNAMLGVCAVLYSA